ncbi:MAG TPA: hypothetical protein VMX13_03320 [Sedimentisphaerales bacterium]|nr:hypothetical protein [Sedimentisphaerales bacterium]
MTEELEKKLNELLGLKKQLEEATEEQQKINTSSLLGQYKKEAKYARIRFWVGVVIGFVFIELGVIGFCSTKLSVMGVDITGPSKFIFGALGMLVGIVIPIGAKLGLRISQSKLAILEELKQFELRITEMLKR